MRSLEQIVQKIFTDYPSTTKVLSILNPVARKLFGVDGGDFDIEGVLEELGRVYQ